MAKSDDRNYDVTIKVGDVLNDIKGFEIARGEPRTGNMIVRYKGTNFLLDISPLFKEENDKDYKDTDFADIVTDFSYLLHS